MSNPNPDEHSYDRHRLRQWLAGDAYAAGVSRRVMLRLLAAAGATAGLSAGSAEAAGVPGIVKPLPEEFFTVRGTNAETNWPALRGTGYHTPVDRFFVRNHTTTPVLDADSWSLRLWGSGLRGGDTVLGLDDLKSLPAVTRSAYVECAGNARDLYASQQGEPVSGTPWTLGAIGQASWRGVPLSAVLRRAGLTREAVDVMPRGLDAEYVSGGVSVGRVRRPMPVAKALDDVLLAYEMNGAPLPPDHGHPVRVLVPSWVGIASIKWAGDIEVSAHPLYSPWNTDVYRLFGPSYPPGGSAPLTHQSLKSAFELPWNATLPANEPHHLTGRSWSGTGGIRSVEISTDNGTTWHHAHLHDTPHPARWTRWSHTWTPTTPGPTTLRARATDTTGETQPDRSVHNTQGYLFDAVVAHPVTVV
ncbi:hypothetical protein SRB5_08630 [Streptomyces sp. RB5]|uniref:Sulfite oxidase n=1 Tax=Streptomyces smaragdinus TaxID=2585196 RepID=A0A7K0CBC0_9ACTN|nr:molybdopterin-dependent oxidoreductase [Streptomyces smaragdinus]MQY10750.1 hypothetical protein [Streptomyces smaragdinus]